MAGSLKFDTWLNDDSTENYKCRAWVNFNGTGTVAIRQSGNVSSITDNGTGDYTVNFTTALEDDNYSWVVSSRGTASNGWINGSTATAPTSTSLRISSITSPIAAVDVVQVNVTIHR